MECISSATFSSFDFSTDARGAGSGGTGGEGSVGGEGGAGGEGSAGF